MPKLTKSVIITSKNMSIKTFFYILFNHHIITNIYNNSLF